MTTDVRYNPVDGWMFIVLGGAGAILQIWPLLLGTFTAFIVFSVSFLVAGWKALVAAVNRWSGTSGPVLSQVADARDQLGQHPQGETEADEVDAGGADVEGGQQETGESGYEQDHGDHVRDLPVR
ncbi:hypothetical protein HS041_18515 [Planomonospora sp. ID67723]|uniref:hypothetical protein n=1 Tax=Planomonospora sp. ID67723 TaxID=2738134 RepID=UPI0018C3EF17|nr:hypothetical protein [Planomonospora sp. ID67723]MBG0829761.1 hypothetical protein [Planomonospora sp. ID67723]